VTTSTQRGLDFHLQLDERPDGHSLSVTLNQVYIYQGPATKLGCAVVTEAIAAAVVKAIDEMKAI